MRHQKFWARDITLAILVATLIVGSGAAGAITKKTIHVFSGGADGSGPTALISDAAGNLYGTTKDGGAAGRGTVFKLAHNADGTWTHTVLFSFSGVDGENPLAGLVWDGTGDLYGTTEAGGDWGYGVVFELMPGTGESWSEQVLHAFNSTVANDGGHPYDALIFDGAGNLYGTTFFGGLHGSGTVFELSPTLSGWQETQLYSFLGQLDGSNPTAGVVFDGAGNLYGTTFQGGSAAANGVLFKLTPNGSGGWSHHVAHWFTLAKGIEPQADLIWDGAGNLYGTARRGGAQEWGVVYKLTPTLSGGWVQTVLHTFTGGNDGSDPQGKLVMDGSGNLYGTTNFGGAFGYGVAFKLAPTTGGHWAETVLWAFQDKPAANPIAGMIIDGSGNLFGTTSGSGGLTFGTVFEITP
jgi:uncharacterized repeat protein (TIGR03803 family)